MKKSEIQRTSAIYQRCSGASTLFKEGTHIRAQYNSHFYHTVNNNFMGYVKYVW